MERVDIRIKRETLVNAGYQSRHKVWGWFHEAGNPLELTIKGCKLFTPANVIGRDEYVTLPGGGSLMTHQVELL